MNDEIIHRHCHINFQSLMQNMFIKFMKINNFLTLMNGTFNYVLVVLPHLVKILKDNSLSLAIMMKLPVPSYRSYFIGLPITGIMSILLIIIVKE